MRTVALLLVGLVRAADAPPPADPLRSAAAAALAAVEGDSVDQVRRRFEEQLGGPSDGASQLGLAYLALYSYDYANADRRFAILRDAAPPATALAAYASLGLAQSALGRWRIARGDTLTGAAIAAARAAGTPLLEAEALLLQALITARLRGPGEAWAAVAHAGSLIPPSEGSLRARLACVRAQLTTSRDLVAALALSLDGATTARAAGNLRHEGHCLFVAAGAIGNAGNADSSLVLFNQAAARQRRARDRAGLAATLQWQGYALLDIGAYGESRALLTEALAQGTASGNPSAVAWGHMILAHLGLATGEYDGVATHVARADSLFRQMGDANGAVALASIEVQRARVVGDRVAARAAAVRFAEGAARYGWHWPVFAQRELAFVEMDAGAWVPARKHLDTALVLARKLGATSLALAVQQDQGIVALRSGDAQGARAMLRRVASLIPKEETAYRHYTLTELALAELQLGETASASATALGAADEVDRWRAGLDDRRLRQTAFDLRRFEDPSFAVASVVTGLAAAGWTDVAFNLAERRRARHLLDRLVLAEGMAVTPASVPRASAAALGYGEVAQSIPDDSTVIVEFVRGGAQSASTVFIVSRNDMRVVALPPSPDLGRRVRRFIGLLEAGAGADSLALSLGNELMQPVLPRLPATTRRLVIVPDLELHGLPFEALRTGGGVLLAQFSMSYAPSASVIARLWQRQRAAGAVTMLALGDPRFAEEVEPGSEAQLFRTAFDRTGGLPRLRASAREARAVARYADRAELRLREDASEADLKQVLPGEFRIVHLATHALVDDRSPGGSALALAAGDGEDGFVSPTEVAALGLSADLLVLSGCRTARGMVTGGEGVDGLAAPAMEAGARAVLASGWLVGDAQTAAFMERFYAHLARGEQLGDALQATKMDLLRAGVPAGGWASFMLLGDPHTALALRAPPAAIPWVPLLIGLLLVAYGAAMVRRRGREETSPPSGSSATTTQR
jgi:tetratricopeptide (TPR) repeat protein